MARKRFQCYVHMLRAGVERNIMIPQKKAGKLHACKWPLRPFLGQKTELFQACLT